jgi:hypothetical protein
MRKRIGAGSARGSQLRISEHVCARAGEGVSAALPRDLQGLLEGAHAIESFQHAGDFEDALDEWGRAEHEVESTISIGRSLLRVQERRDRRCVDELH